MHNLDLHIAHIAAVLEYNCTEIYTSDIPRQLRLNIDCCYPYLHVHTPVTQNSVNLMTNFSCTTRNVNHKCSSSCSRSQMCRGSLPSVSLARPKHNTHHFPMQLRQRMIFQCHNRCFIVSAHMSKSCFILWSPFKRGYFLFLSSSIHHFLLKLEIFTSFKSKTLLSYAFI